MAIITVTNTERDGDMCVVTFNVDADTGDPVAATTSENVVGHIKQIGVLNSSGISNAFTMVLEDTSNNMRLFSGSTDIDDIKTVAINNGSGAYCRGPLKLSVSGTQPTVDRVIKVYFEKM